MLLSFHMANLSDPPLTCVNHDERDSSIMREKTAAASAELKSGRRAR